MFLLDINVAARDTRENRTIAHCPTSQKQDKSPQIRTFRSSLTLISIRVEERLELFRFEHQSVGFQPVVKHLGGCIVGCMSTSGVGFFRVLPFLGDLHSPAES